ncbi:MAG: DHH family phosphoesterase [Phycisphaerae bacterium]|jgi:nanoRNase/pAp phosphatase (c-di-AMP/oligoRNAs hydrolase)
MAGKRPKRSDRLLGVLDEYRETQVIMHNNPDPDAMASGWALVTLVEKRLHKPVRLLGRGPIVRAENRQFVRLLRPPIEFVDELTADVQTATVLVDCSPASFNHLLDGRVPPTAVIDHHESKRDGFRIRFRDMRPKVTASASISAGYMREQNLEPSSEMATGLVYAIRTEMIGAQKPLSRVDHSVMRWLSTFADYDLLSEIENPPLPRHYYEELLLALKNVRIYADSALCFLPRMTAPELVGEFADLLIRCDGLQCVLCGGRVEDDVLFSARSKRGERTALHLLSTVLGGLGRSGGHRHRAGGRVALPVYGKTLDELEQEVRAKWLDACASTVRRGQRLVGGKEIRREP